MKHSQILSTEIRLEAIATRKLLELISFEKNLLALYLRLLNIGLSFIYIASAGLQE